MRTPLATQELQPEAAEFLNWLGSAGYRTSALLAGSVHTWGYARNAFASSKHVALKLVMLRVNTLDGASFLAISASIAGGQCALMCILFELALLLLARWLVFSPINYLRWQKCSKHV